MSNNEIPILPQNTLDPIVPPVQLPNEANPPNKSNPPNEPNPTESNTESETKSDDSDTESCKCDDTHVEVPDCKPTCVPITLELAPVVSLLVNKPKVCVKNKAVCKPKFFLDQ